MPSSSSRSHSESKSTEGSETCLHVSFQRRHYIIILRLLIIPLLAILTILFLVLSGVSGPESGLWWIDITYRGDGRLGTEVIGYGDEWELGGLGGCLKIGSEWQDGQKLPNHFGQIHPLLIFHLATSAIFFLTATFSWIIFHFPSSSITKRYGTLFPLFAPLFPLIVLIADITVYHRIQVATDVETTMSEGTYWLGPSSFPLSVLWVMAIQYDGYLKRQDLATEEADLEEARERRRERRREREAQVGGVGIAEKAVGAAMKWWPWSGKRR